ncbi:MAG: HAD-IIA family hydrolase [Victivallales bacterium]|jgi:NagD protein
MILQKDRTMKNIPNQTFLKWWGRNSCEFSALLFDIDGTLISGKRAMPGVPALIRQLEDGAFPFFLLTNDGNHSTREKSLLLKKAGLDIKADEIISCGDALKPFARENGLAGQKFFVMGDLGKPSYAEKAGLKVEKRVKNINECSGVIVGEGTYNWQSNISSAMNYFIKYPDRPLIVPNPDSYWPNGPNGELGIGAGGKARFICTILGDYGIRLRPVYLGKPYRAIFDYAFEILKTRFGLPANLPRKRILMLGDSLASDIRGANRFGFTSGLVLTGITNHDHIRKAKPSFKPDHIFPKIN